MDDAMLLELAAELAGRAGEAILEVRARGFATHRKLDRSPVTEADHAAEAIIVAGLRGAAPGLAVIAEEEVEAGQVHAVGEAYWLVDPLDGTREFAAGRDEFTVNVGLVRGGVPVLGAVGVPAFGEVFGGRVGAGAWKQVGGVRAAVRARAVPAGGMAVLASRSYAADPALRAYLEGLVVDGLAVAGVVNMGSALKIMRVAEGVADLYPRMGPTMEWDTAAPQAVLEAAGGALCVMEGGRLRYGKAGWLNPGFVCTGLR